jgi:hypothetical protein
VRQSVETMITIKRPARPSSDCPTLTEDPQPIPGRSARRSREWRTTLRESSMSERVLFQK